MNSWSRLPNFHNLPLKKRREILCQLPIGIDENHFHMLDNGLPFLAADAMSENVIGTFGLPLSVAPNFLIDEKAVIIPMVTEEPSIIAAVSKMAKIVASCGGFFTKVDSPLMRGQIQIYDFLDIDGFAEILNLKKNFLIDYANHSFPSLIARGGGLKDIILRKFKKKSINPMLVLEPIIDVVDAMGANIINSYCELLGQKIESEFRVKVCLKILSNLSTERLVFASCKIPIKLFATDSSKDNGLENAKRIILAHSLAEQDIYRACTHNKGILNGIDAVAIATGNDTRAISANAHTYAAMNDSYQPLTSMNLLSDVLEAKLKLPLAIGVVGQNTKIHQGVQFSLKCLGDFGKSAKGLSSVMVSVGLAQCLAALFAMVSFGIQKGHMKLHSKKQKYDI